jgi:hypothetical protein
VTDFRYFRYYTAVLRFYIYNPPFSVTLEANDTRTTRLPGP